MGRRIEKADFQAPEAKRQKMDPEQAKEQVLVRFQTPEGEFAGPEVVLSMGTVGVLFRISYSFFKVGLKTLSDSFYKL